MTTFLSTEVIQATTSKGAVMLGLENKIRDVCANPKFEIGIKETIRVIWTHYCGANPDFLTQEFEDEAIDLIKKKFGMLGVNEIKEAFRLASVNVISSDMRAFHGRINTQVIGNVLSSYLEYRKPIAAEILRMKTQQQKEEEEEKAQLDMIEYQKKVLEWFESKELPKDIYDCPFYFFDTLAELSLIEITKEQKHEYFRKAKVLRLNEIEQSKRRTGTIDEIQKANRLLSQTMEGDENAIITNIAKRIALYDIKTNQNK
jgi:hypothetical protein